jgi:hypothetical protein
MAEKVSNVTKGKIIATWAARQERVQSARLTWDQERTYTKYWVHCNVPMAREEYITLRVPDSRLCLQHDKLRFDAGQVGSDGDRLMSAVDHLQPGNLADFHKQAVRIFRNDRIRYDDGRPHADPRSPAETSWPRNVRSFTTAYDGETNWQFLSAERGLYPEAYIYRDTNNRFIESLYYRAIMIALRPMKLNIHPENLSLNEDRVHLNGRECLIVYDRWGLGREFWVDPSREFIVVRYIENCDVMGARMKTQIDISYQAHDEVGWIPSGWRTIFYDNHGLMEQYAPTIVTDYSINESVSPENFQPSFPAGTWVFDESIRDGYLVRASGGKRIVTADELQRGVNYVDLVQTDSGMARSRSAAWSLMGTSWRQGAAMVLLLAGLLFVVRRRLQRRAVRVMSYKNSSEESVDSSEETGVMQ